MLAISILLCYSGVCITSVVAGESSDPSASHCEMSGNGSERSGDAIWLIETPGADVSDETPCCLETLTNAAVEDNLIYSGLVTAIEDYRSDSANHGRSCASLLIENSAHGPPLIYLSVKSSFLL